MKPGIHCRPCATWWYLASIFVLVLGTGLSANRYPGGFDWIYNVASALGSRQDNPDGFAWYAGALGLSMLLMWPYVSAVERKLGSPAHAATRIAIRALKTGLFFGVVLGMERMFFADLSSVVTKGHEVIAIFTFFGLQLGLFMLMVQAMSRRRIYALSAFLVAAPLLAIAIGQIFLFVAQRDIGWAGVDWRELGTPFWMSFAFWQWLAIVFICIGLGLLSFISSDDA
jgi:hypothetical protein